MVREQVAKMTGTDHRLASAFEAAKYCEVTEPMPFTVIEAFLVHMRELTS